MKNDLLTFNFKKMEPKNQKSCLAFSAIAKKDLAKDDFKEIEEIIKNFIVTNWKIEKSEMHYRLYTSTKGDREALVLAIPNDLVAERTIINPKPPVPPIKIPNSNFNLQFVGRLTYDTSVMTNLFFEPFL